MDFRFLGSFWWVESRWPWPLSPSWPSNVHKTPLVMALGCYSLELLRLGFSAFHVPVSHVGAGIEFSSFPTYRNAVNWGRLRRGYFSSLLHHDTALTPLRKHYGDNLKKLWFKCRRGLLVFFTWCQLLHGIQRWSCAC